ncbi:MAG: Ig-like domain-containing protein [Ignavibacteriales bacterium]|nr:Ig-like domain-containing protein [Ignavibacteriales bacterium]
MKRRMSVFALLSVLVLAAVGCKKESPTEPTDTAPPTVSILSPLNNSAVTDTVLVQVQASDNVGVTKVEFYIDGVLVLTKGTAPWEYRWATKGLQVLSTHTIIAKAYDASSNVGTSPTDTVTIKDVTIPIVSILTPANNSVVSDTVTITVQASDDVGVSKVEFYIDANLASTKSSAPWVYKWPTRGLPSLSVHSLVAKAYDGSGNVGTSSTISVVLKDIIPPVIAILSPANNASVQDTVLIQAQATDDIGVVKVEVYIDAVLASNRTSSPWQYAWITTSLVPLTAHTISAKAYDAAGNIGTSSTVNTTIQQPVGTITGNVVDAVSANPIANVQITTTPATSTVTSDNSGNYSITGALPGAYKVVASQASYRSDSVTISVGRWATVKADFRLFQVTALPSAGLVAYYPFNGNAKDQSANSYDGVVHGTTPLTMDRFQKVNSAYQFDGSSSYIDIPNTSNLNFLTGGFSLAAWINFTDDTRTQCIFGKGLSNVTAGYLLAIVGSKVDLVVDGQFAVADNSTIKGSWHFVCGVYDGTNGYLYIDGQQRAMTSMTYVHASTANIKIGNIDVPENFFKGMIDDVRLYNRPLAPAEVQLLYHEGGW